MRCSRAALCALAFTAVVDGSAPARGAAWDAAESYPVRPIRLIVAFAAGGSVDLVARLIAQKLTEAWGQQVVVDNRPGAGGNLSAELVARAPPDGYTLYVSSASLVVNASLYRKLPYDPIKDFAPVTLLATVQNVLVAHPSVPAGNVDQLVALAKKAPGKLNYASTGSGSSGHLTMELFKSMTGTALIMVPVQGGGAGPELDLISGEVSLWFPTIRGALPFIKAGKMKALAVAGPCARLRFPTCRPLQNPAYQVSTPRPGSGTRAGGDTACHREQGESAPDCDTEHGSGEGAAHRSRRRAGRLDIRGACEPSQERARQMGGCRQVVRSAARLKLTGASRLLARLWKHAEPRPAVPSSTFTDGRAPCASRQAQLRARPHLRATIRAGTSCSAPKSTPPFYRRVRQAPSSAPSSRKQ